VNGGPDHDVPKWLMDPSAPAASDTAAALSLRDAATAFGQAVQICLDLQDEAKRTGNAREAAGR
jgi:hypothetical protein